MIASCLIFLGLSLVSIADPRLQASGDALNAPPSVSGIYPHLAIYNDENECGIGGVVDWAGRLWVITYAPHKPRGSSDRLHSIGPDLQARVHPESVGGTHACRMIHRESGQLVLGPYLIDEEGSVRCIPPDRMPGRLTGVARHLSNPEERIYFATMEEGLYEVELDSLAVREIYADDQAQISGGSQSEQVANLPGYHGKGLYSSQGRLVYANNGEPGPEAQSNPDMLAGCLAEWSGERWHVLRRQQFTEVTGPGSLYGNSNPSKDPIWSIGWDAKSLILMLLDDGVWHSYRLPKTSHAYDGAHGWNTEWPRIRDVGASDFLMTMHGSFWSFPPEFRAHQSAGIHPLSSYLKVIGDVESFEGRLVFGCDDVARSEFLNTSRFKAGLIGPGQSHSNLWFVEGDQLEALGPPIGRGAIWLGEPVEAGEWGEPMLFEGFEQRGVHLAHDHREALRFDFQVDLDGSGSWRDLRSVFVAPNSYAWRDFEEQEAGVWIRARVNRDVEKLSVMFHGRAIDRRDSKPADLFGGLAMPFHAKRIGGLLRARGGDLGTLAVVATQNEGQGEQEVGFYELHANLSLRPSGDAEALAWHRDRLQLDPMLVEQDAASLWLVDEDGQRWRLPRSTKQLPRRPSRLCREVVTERDLLHVGNLFYELPARNAGGIAKLRPIAAHPFDLHDFAGFRGLIVLSGVNSTSSISSRHLIRSEDGRAAVWVGSIDDLWKLGRPRGFGGPWLESKVEAGVCSDPFLMTGFNRRSYQLEHRSPLVVRIDLEVDISGTGDWHLWRTHEMAPGQKGSFEIPEDFDAYWIRARTDFGTTATLQFEYR